MNDKIAATVAAMTDVTTGRKPHRGADPSVDHPKHYNTHPSGVECIDLIRPLKFSLGSAVKYLWRAGLKGDPSVRIQDLQKAVWYLADYKADRTSDLHKQLNAPRLDYQWGRVIACEPDQRRRSIWVALLNGDVNECARLVELELSRARDELMKELD